MGHLLFALGFLTSIPVRTPAPRPGDLSRAAIWFPLVGLLIGVVLIAAQSVFSRFFTPLLSAALVVAIWTGLTGALHLDGLADCCDGLLAETTPERRLEIMHDPRLGAFGGVGLIIHLTLKTLAVASLAVPSIVALTLAPSLARWLILIVAQQPAARPGGMGAAFAAGLNRTTVLGAAIVPLVLIGLGLPRSIFAALAAALVALVIVRLARTRLGGMTGDVFGLTIEATELAVLLVFSATLAG